MYIPISATFLRLSKAGGRECVLWEASGSGAMWVDAGLPVRLPRNQRTDRYVHRLCSAKVAGVTRAITSNIPMR